MGFIFHQESVSTSNQTCPDMNGKITAFATARFNTKTSYRNMIWPLPLQDGYEVHVSLFQITILFIFVTWSSFNFSELIFEKVRFTFLLGYLDMYTLTFEFCVAAAADTAAAVLMFEQKPIKINLDFYPYTDVC